MTSPSRDGYQVYMGNIMKQVQVADIRKLFNGFDIGSINIKQFCAFVQFMSLKDMKEAIRLYDQSRFFGVRIKVEAARGTEQALRGGYGRFNNRRSPPPYRRRSPRSYAGYNNYRRSPGRRYPPKVYEMLVTNLPPRCTYQHLREVANQYGDVAFVRVVPEHEEATVLFRNSAGLDRAIEKMDKMTIMDREIRCSEKRPRSPSRRSSRSRSRSRTRSSSRDSRDSRAKRRTRSRSSRSSVRSNRKSPVVRLVSTEKHPSPPPSPSAASYTKWNASQDDRQSHDERQSRDESPDRKHCQTESSQQSSTNELSIKKVGTSIESRLKNEIMGNLMKREKELPEKEAPKLPPGMPQKFTFSFKRTNPGEKTDENRGDRGVTAADDAMEIAASDEEEEVPEKPDARDEENEQAPSNIESESDREVSDEEEEEEEDEESEENSEISEATESEEEEEEQMISTRGKNSNKRVAPVTKKSSAKKKKVSRDVSAEVAELKKMLKSAKKKYKSLVSAASDDESSDEEEEEAPKNKKSKLQICKYCNCPKRPKSKSKKRQATKVTKKKAVSKKKSEKQRKVDLKNDESPRPTSVSKTKSKKKSKSDSMAA